RDARTHDLREPVDVDGVHAGARLDLRPHLVRPRLRAEDADAERRRARVEPLALELVEDREHVRRRHHDHGRLEVGEQPHLALRHAARHRHHGAAEPLRAVMRAEAAGEEPVAVGDVDDVAGASAGRPDGARDAWIRTTRSRGTANIPVGYVSRRSSFVVNGKRRRSSSVRQSSGWTPAPSKELRYRSTLSYACRSVARSRSSWSAASSSRDATSISSYGSATDDPAPAAELGDH